MVRHSLWAALVASLFFCGPASTADLPMTAPAVTPHCAVAGDTRLLYVEDHAQLTHEVVRLMDEAVAVSESPRWVGSSRPVFLWASETKVACGKAYGYLQSHYRDAEYLSKCDCFHARMIDYMH